MTRAPATANVSDTKIHNERLDNSLFLPLVLPGGARTPRDMQNTTLLLVAPLVGDER